MRSRKTNGIQEKPTAADAPVRSGVAEIGGAREVSDAPEPGGLEPAQTAEPGPDCEETIHKGGFRFTKQRREVYDALMTRRDHPTAVEVFLRVKDRVPNISLATVYNCLETLTKCGLVRQVNLERAPSRFCPNLEDHGHFFCEDCGKVMDVTVADPQSLVHSWQLPANCIVTNQEFTLRGLCPECVEKSPRNTTESDRPHSL